jgi:hypothetical protein
MIGKCGHRFCEKIMVNHILKKRDGDLSDIPPRSGRAWQVSHGWFHRLSAIVPGTVCRRDGSGLFVAACSQRKPVSLFAGERRAG